MSKQSILLVGLGIFCFSLIMMTNISAAIVADISTSTLSAKWKEQKAPASNYRLLQGEEYDAIASRLIERLLSEDSANIKRLSPFILQDKEGGHFLIVRKQEGRLKGKLNMQRERLAYLLGQKVGFNVAEVRMEALHDLPAEVISELRKDTNLEEKVGLIRAVTDYDDHPELLVSDDGQMEAIAFYTWTGSSDHKFNRKNSYVLENGKTVISFDHDQGFAIEGWTGFQWLDTLLEKEIPLDFNRLREFTYKIEAVSDEEIIQMIRDTGFEKPEEVITYLIDRRDNLRQQLAELVTEFPELNLNRTVEEVYSSLWSEKLTPKDNSYTVEQLLEEYQIEVIEKKSIGRFGKQYRVHISKKRRFIRNTNLNANIDFTVYPRFRTIWVENFYPNFEKGKRKGAGRALIRYLFERYHGYEKLSIASDQLLYANERIAEQIGAVFIRRPEAGFRWDIRDERVTLLEEKIERLEDGRLKTGLGYIMSHWNDANNYFRFPGGSNQLEEILLESA